jgi:hypothetical protein
METAFLIVLWIAFLGRFVKNATALINPISLYNTKRRFARG